MKTIVLKSDETKLFFRLQAFFRRYYEEKRQMNKKDFSGYFGLSVIFSLAIMGP